MSPPSPVSPTVSPRFPETGVQGRFPVSRRIWVTPERETHRATLEDHLGEAAGNTPAARSENDQDRRNNDARQAFAVLADALADRGPAPCESSDAELWWSADPDDVELAVFACWQCPVRPECLAYALAGRERYGVWGAATPDERRTCDQGVTTGSLTCGDAPLVALGIRV